MKIISNRNENEDLIAKVLKRVSPVSIAVAYVGKDWKSYADTFKEIVVSPTIGSNPYALKDIIDQIGADNVYFLDELHSKIYLGDNSALIGSANLSNNALSDYNLLETVALVEDADSLKQLRSTIDFYKEQSRKLYKDKEATMARLQSLIDQTKPPSVNYRSVNFRDYDIDKSNNRIIIAWYSDDRLKLNSEAIKDSGANYNPDEDCTNTFFEDDEILNDDWILNWRITSAEKPHKALKPFWMKVTRCISESNEDELYTKIAYERNLKSATIPPFELDEDVIEVFKELMGKAKYSKFWKENTKISGADVWLAPSQAETRDFLREWQKLLKSI
jgi:hypothetical protein